MNKSMDQHLDGTPSKQSGPKRQRRPGRRAGGSVAREQILEAARARFSAHGYGGTTIRAVASEADVDAALVHYFFGTKDELFAAAMALPFNPAEIVGAALEGSLDGLGERLVRGVLDAWDGPRARHSLLALIRSASSHETAAATLRQFIERGVVGRLAAAVGGPDAQLRATLAGSQVAGLIVARYVLEVEPLASAEPETVVAAVGPTLQRYLTGTLEGPAGDPSSAPCPVRRPCRGE